MAFKAFRQRLGSIIGGFDAAQAHRRLRGFRASRAHVNTLIAASGETITARARWLVRNNGYAANAVDAFANHVVGDGIKPSSKIADAAKKEELHKLWLAWTDEADADVERLEIVLFRERGVLPLLLLLVVDLAGLLLLDHLAEHFVSADPEAQFGEAGGFGDRE